MTIKVVDPVESRIKITNEKLENQYKRTKRYRLLKN